MTDVSTLKINGPACELAVHVSGNPAGPPVLMTHSILSSSQMWQAQAALLVASGWRVIRADTRGHGQSGAPDADQAANTTMADLVADSVAVLDALKIERAHYVGLSLGGMSGFGLALHQPQRLLSAVICDARADMPAALGAVWDERMALATREQSCAGLAQATLERWFGPAFLAANSRVAEEFRHSISRTSVAGFVGAARAIQGLDYLSAVGQINIPVSFIVGANDGPLPGVMAQLQSQIKNATLAVIPDAGHLPNIDNARAFNAALLRHFFSNPHWSL